jgi:hypothetical protein
MMRLGLGASGIQPDRTLAQGRSEMETIAYLDVFKPLMSMARETLPQGTAAAARNSLEQAARALGLELIENKSTAPSFLLLPPEGAGATAILFAAWHSEPGPVLPAAVEGSERLALAATLAGLAEVEDGAGPAGSRQARAPAVAVVVHPASGQGSLRLSELLASHRDRLRAPAAFWVRVQPAATKRRRVYLGSRGRIALGIWGGERNPYQLRDELVGRLRDEAYGPRPLDFELLRKLATTPAALDFLEAALDDPGAVAGEGEDRLRAALFEPRGQVVSPRVAHPDRPRAWILIEGAEAMDPAEVLRAARDQAPGSTVEMAEGYPWDRINIHHPSIQAEIALSKSVSEGPEIWPAAPWVTPSGIFTRTLGVPLAEWGIPLPAGTTVRAPSPEGFAAIAREVAALLSSRRGEG